MTRTGTRTGTRNRNRILVGAAAAALLLAACSSNPEPEPTEAPTEETSAPAPTETEGAGSMNVTEKDFSVSLDPTEVPAGEVAFRITNEGPSVHEFVVFKTNLAADALPVDSEGAVDEEGKGVEHQGEVEDIAVGATANLSLELDAGSYVALCNLPGHYIAGMTTGFTVT